jgi:hypothetical protein
VMGKAGLKKEAGSQMEWGEPRCHMSDPFLAFNAEYTAG